MKTPSLTIKALLASILMVFLLNPLPGVADEAGVGIKVMQKERLGRFLADGKGRSLYIYAKDRKNFSNCIEGCALNWPPFHADPSVTVTGCDPGDFSTISRDDGRKQTTYKGSPLYYFINDKYPGDTFGHELGGVWSIVTPPETGKVAD